jgi:hypothetical protein
VATLAERLGTEYDLMLAVTRGGLVPAGMLAYRLDLRRILVAGAELYGPSGPLAAGPRILHFPPSTELHGQRLLLVDEVWETGQTLTHLTELARQAGALPTTAVLHYKPARSRVATRPDFFAAETDRWIVYPYKAGD